MTHVGRTSQIHAEFYGASDGRGGAVLDADSQLQGKGPDVKAILRRRRTSVFSGVHIVFSAMFPRMQNRRPEDHPVWKQTERFGACVSNEVKRGVTHVVARNPGTDKTMQAMDLGVWVVSPRWLERSISEWQRKPEGEYAFVQLERHRKGKMEAGTAVFVGVQKPTEDPAPGAFPPSTSALPAVLPPATSAAEAAAAENDSDSDFESSDEEGIAELEELLLS